MVAPAGVNEEMPQEPAAAGLAPAEVLEGQAASQEPPPADAAPAGAAGPADAAPAGEDRAETEPGEAEPAEADEPDWDAAETRHDVSPFAVVGIIFGVIALVGVAAGVLALVTHGFRPKTVITYRPAAVFGLRPGECVNLGAGPLDFTVLSCATPHDAEVFATFSLPETGWPGASAVQQRAGDGCASRLSGYLNPQLATADLTQEFVYPNKDAWRAGQRTVVCEVRAVSGQLSGSVRAPG